MTSAKKQSKGTRTPCPLAKTAAVIGNAYVLLMVRDLLEGPRHFCELESSLAGISTRTLAQKLKMLEKKGLVTRSGGVLPRTRAAYTLTARGRGLKKVADAMVAYGKKYL